jgi:hypothetical protein
MSKSSPWDSARAKLAGWLRVIELSMAKTIGRRANMTANKDHRINFPEISVGITWLHIADRSYVG